MANTNYFHGLEFRWSTNGLLFTGYGSILIQSFDNNNTLTEHTYLNQLGNTAIWAGSDLRKEVTFEIIPASVTTSDGNLATSGYQFQQGIMLQVQDTIDASSTINGTNWIVINISEGRNVADAAKFRGSLKAFGAITT